MLNSHRFFHILIAESFSCQRDLLLNLQNSWLKPYLKIFTCHSRHRAEISTVADVYLPNMPSDENAAQWLFDQCVEQQIKLVFIGKNSAKFEPYRAQFEVQGIIFITGSIGHDHHLNIDDKYAFTQLCLAQQLPAIPAYRFDSVDSFLQTYAQANQTYPQHILCAKPVKGVFAHGFIRFKEDANFNGLFTVPVEITTEDFCDQYGRLSHPPAYILMPFLTGQECSVDIACDHGKIISMATRLKADLRQKIKLSADCDELCHQLVQLFCLDGLINIQFKQNQQGKWYILEINARPAGGFSYSMHTGRNLIADLIARKLALPQDPHPQLKNEVFVYPFTSSLSESL